MKQAEGVTETMCHPELLWVSNHFMYMKSFTNAQNGKQYDTIFYRAGSDNDPVQGFVMARCKKQVEEASVQYAFMNATPVTTKADSILTVSYTHLYPPRRERRRSDFGLRCRQRFLSGMGQDTNLYDGG